MLIIYAYLLDVFGHLVVAVGRACCLRCPRAIGLYWGRVVFAYGLSWFAKCVWWTRVSCEFPCFSHFVVFVGLL